MMKTKKNVLSQSIKLILAGSMLISGAANAVLLDHGPSDAVLSWPQWYRDNNSTAVGLCKSTAASPNAAGGTMCFPLVADTAGFPGNVGAEIFYNYLQYKQKPGAATGFNFSYTAALESAYLSLVPTKGQEILFARLRFTLNFNNPAWNGDYTVIHPYGQETFTNVTATTTNTLVGNNAAVFVTFDVPAGLIGDYNAAMDGPIGPFLEWDVINPGETLTVGNETFLGDPTINHTFKGSPFIDAAGKPQNYIEVRGPAGAVLNDTLVNPTDLIGQDGYPRNVLHVNQAVVLGQRWKAPIASNLAVDHAQKSRNVTTGVNAVDVWATAVPAHKLILTGAGLPSMQLLEDAVTKGKYHGHVEYPLANDVPASILVTDETSNPIVSSSKQVIDSVDITLASYNTITGELLVKAESSDEATDPALAIGGISGVTTNLTALACADTVAFGVSSADAKCFKTIIPLTQEPPVSISVSSSAGGISKKDLFMVNGNPQNISPAPVIPVGTSSVFTANITGTTTITLPLNAILIKQPASGLITPTAANGVFTFTPNVGTVVGVDSFQFAIQNPTPGVNAGAVSLAKTATLNLALTATAPVTTADQYGAARTVARTLDVLTNDKASTADALNALNAGSVKIVGLPTNGTAVANVNGTITYTGRTAGITDSFTYTVANVSGTVSAPTTVQVTTFAGPEVITFTRAPSFTKGRWAAIAGNSTWFNAALSTNNIRCYLTANAGVALTPRKEIGTGAAVDVTGKFQIPAATAPLPTTGTGTTVQCVSPSGAVVNSGISFK